MPALQKAFRLYLKSQDVSNNTIKNYLSDFRHFWGWFLLTLKIDPQEKNFQTIVGQISQPMIENYKNFLLKNKVPKSTVNRRLSSLRKFGQFCLRQGWLKTNPGQKVQNTSLQVSRSDKKKKILVRFRQSLEKENISSATSKNYLSDLRHFLGWLELTT